MKNIFQLVEEQIQRLSLVSPHAEGNHRSNTQSAPDIRDYILLGLCVVSPEYISLEISDSVQFLAL